MNKRQFLRALSGLAVLSALPLWVRAGRQAISSDVIVVGAGLSGLSSAHALQAAGARVNVLEASQRIGGRAYTVTRNGLRFELGGVLVGEGYTRLRAHARRLGIGIVTPPPALPRNAEMGIVLGNTLTRGSQWTDSPLNSLQGHEHALPPPRLLSAAISASALSTIDAWRDPARLALDISLASYLAAQGWSPQALEWMDIGHSFTSLHTISALDALRRDVIRRFGPQHVDVVEGGSQALPEAMAAALTEPPIFGAHVVRVQTHARGVEVHCADGRRFNAAHLILAIPSGPLSRVVIDPAPPAEQQQVWVTRRSNAVTTIHLQPTRRFWEDDDQPLSLWSDGPLQRVFPALGEDGQVNRLTIWLNGVRAEQADQMQADVRMAWGIAAMERLYPAAKGALHPLETRSWGTEPLADGAFSEIAPGHFAQTLHWNSRPFGRIHFAGEHTELGAPGMEAAVRSGERAAAEILAA